MSIAEKTTPSQGVVDKGKMWQDDNLYIWKMADVTDPRHTKPISLGRKMTAIDSYYQIKRATESFGPWGLGWGYTSHEEVLNIGATPMAKVRMVLWYIDPDTTERITCSPIVAMNRLMMGQGVDEEAFKKATTDALTKSLSYLGFSADVFMGLFDSQKYVDQTKAAFEKKDEQQAQEYQLAPALKKAIADLKTCKTQDAFTKLKEGIKAEFDRITDKASQRYVALQFRKKELELWPEINDDNPERKADAAA